MVRFTRLLATRLRRSANHPTRALGARPASAEAWARLEYACTAPLLSAAATHQRELMQENVRLSITLIGQQGRGAVARILAACNGEIPEASAAVRVALAVAEALGHTA